MLRLTEFLFLARMPADSRGIENNFRTAQRREPRRFRIPLVPANADADVTALRFPSLEPEIARREIKFLVIKRVVRDVHLAILAEHFSIGIENNGGIVIKTGAAFLEKRRDDDDAKFSREFPESTGRSSGNFLRQREVRVIFRLTKILRSEKFRQANDLRSFFCGVANEIDSA